RLQLTLNIIGAWLAVYVITHGGRGPEGFLGDENDVCMALVMLLPFALQNAISLRAAKRLPYIGLSLLSLVAIVITESRGGFLGVVALFGVLLLRSPKKIPMLLSAGLVILLAIPFAGDKYWGEVKSISASEGTGKERMDTWGYVWKMFLDPKNTIQGVGISNSPYNIGFYEPASAGISQKTLQGRAVHSTFFELLGDQGLIGLALVGSIFGGSILETVKNGRRLSQLARARLSTDPGLGRIAAEYSNRLHIMSVAIQCSWAGALVSSMFIATLYYPPLWILVTISAIHAAVTTRIAQAISKNEHRAEVEVIPA
ncbi:MAG: O-antigen ligase family protein, partial [bacterium]|nr:O-antigen ligase family protein [bacterium]